MNWLKKLLPKKADDAPATPQLALARYVARAQPRADIAVLGGAGSGRSTLLAHLFQAVGAEGVKATVILQHPTDDIWVARSKAGELPLVALHFYDWKRRMSVGSRAISSPEFQSLNIRIGEEAIHAAKQGGAHWLIVEWVELTRESVSRVRAYRDAHAADLGLIFVVNQLDELGEALDQLGALVVMYSARGHDSAWPTWLSEQSRAEALTQRATMTPGDNLIYLPPR